MTLYALIANNTITALWDNNSASAPLAAGYTDITGQTGAITIGSTLVNGVWTAPPIPIAQQASLALSAGLEITSTSTPSLNATYPCDAATQSNISSMFDLIQRSGGNAFPDGITSLPWPVMTGTVTFNSVSEFLAMETAVGNYVLALDLIITTGTGTLPSASVTIP
jgi:hypothetical protein